MELPAMCTTLRNLVPMRKPWHRFCGSLSVETVEVTRYISTFTASQYADTWSNRFELKTKWTSECWTLCLNTIFTYTWQTDCHIHDSDTTKLYQKMSQSYFLVYWLVFQVVTVGQAGEGQRLKNQFNSKNVSFERFRVANP